MREFAISIDEELTRGLRPRKEYNGEGTFLKELFNLRPYQGGLRRWKSPKDPFNGNEPTNWPWPQILSVGNRFCLARENSISLIDSSTNPWTTAELDLYDPKNPTLAVGLPTGGGTWHAADAQDAWYLFKGNATVFSLGLSDKIYVDRSVPINTGTYHKGRFVVGGFESGNFWNEFETIFSSWTTSYEEDIPFDFGDVGENWIAWSSIGGGDLPAWLFYPNDVGARTGLNEERFVKRLLRNELGFMPMPFDGEVLNIKHFSENVLLVYGTDGVAAVELSGTRLRGEDKATSTYGVRQISDVGLASRDAVSGTTGQHIFLDKNGRLWAITGELDVQLLDYREHLKDLVGGEVVSVYNPFEEEFVLSSSDLGFVFTGEGLAEHKDRLTTLSSSGAEAVALSHNPGPNRVRIKTGDLDFGVAARKRLQNVQVEGRGLEDLKSSLRLVQGTNGAMKKTPKTRHNREGIGYHFASSTDFRVEVEARPREGAEISRIIVAYQLEDKRAIRGPVNANQT